MQASAARESRALQFVPGHVGGRIASAQPVKRRRTVGAAAATPATPPDGVLLWAQDEQATFGTSITLTAPAPPASTVWAVGLFHSSSFGSVDLPAGWVQLATGSLGSDPRGSIKCWTIAAAPWTVDTGRTVGFSDIVADSSASTGAAVVAYFQGAAAEGGWSVIDGPTYVGTSLAGFTAVPDGTASWVQFAAVTGVYQIGTSYPSGITVGQGFCTSYCHPYAGTTFAGAAYEAEMAAPVPSSALWDYGNLGAYGTPHSAAFAVIWRP